jgi:hypothetical protein
MNKFLLLLVWLHDTQEWKPAGLFTYILRLEEYCENEGIALDRIEFLDGNVKYISINANSYAKEIEVIA